MHPELTYVDSLTKAVTGADVIMLLTEWDEFRSMSPDSIGAAGRQAQPRRRPQRARPAQWRAAGWHYRALGRP